MRRSQFFKDYFRLLRIPQWIKNFFVFVPLLFAKELFQQEHFFIVLLAFFAFCFTSSAVYIINDIFDIEEDKLHPAKKFRPIAAGRVSISSAIITAVLLVLITSSILTFLDFRFFLVVLGYTLMNIFYSIALKQIVIVDIITIASGFMLRVLGGAYVIEVSVSSWLILTTLFISLFLAIMKRRSELVLEESGAVTRKVLSEYSVAFTEQMASISAAGVIICYALYSVSDRTVNYLKGESMVFTTIFVVFGIFRFMYLVYKKSKGENATEIMVSDPPMLINIVLYVLTSIYIVYF